MVGVLIGGLVMGGVVYFKVKKCPISPQVKKENFLPPQEAVQKAIDFINQNLLKGKTASLIEASEESGIYKFKIKIGNNEGTLFVTKDGKILFPIAYDITQKPKNSKKQSLEKRERPDVKLFVMSYCPFGLQMEKAILPVWKLLKDKADIGVYFVDYIMHGKKEMQENLRQYCIQKEQNEKYLDYLSCFLENGDFENCLNKAKIDKEKLNLCVKQTDEEFKISENFDKKRFPPFNVHKELNEKYGVAGSPTLVINDKVVTVERSPEKIKEVICKAFLNQPQQCQQKLSSEVLSPGFGFKKGSFGGGSCR